MGRKDGCTFCGIVSGHQRAEVVYKDDLVMAFLDRFRQPSVGGHILVIPCEHHENIWTLPESLCGPLMRVSQALAKAVRDTIPGSGIRLWTANGRSAGQEILHFHIHVLPCRSALDRIRYVFPFLSGKQHHSGKALVEMAKPIRSRLQEILDQSDVEPRLSERQRGASDLG